jgi:hypothetical protein
VVVVRDEAHVVGVDGAEGGEAVADDGEEGDKHIVDYVDDVVVAAADVDPALASYQLVLGIEGERGVTD